MREIMDKSEAFITTRKISKGHRVCWSLLNCVFDMITFSFIYLYSQKTAAMKAGYAQAQGISKLRRITLS